MSNDLNDQQSQNQADVLDEEQIAQLPLYEWDVANVGDRAKPFTYLVTEESIADYCLAVRNTNPLYLDPEAAKNGPFGGIVAPPTYIFKCAPQRRNELMHAMGYASPEEKRDRATPFAKTAISFYRPIKPGDEITSVVELKDKYERRGNQFITLHVSAENANGEPVAEYDYTIIWRRGEQAQKQQSAKQTPAKQPSSPPPGTSVGELTKQETQETIDQYSELTRVRPRFSPSLHSDPDFAQRTIFGGTVNMGVATCAYCAELLEQTFGPNQLLSPGASLEYKGIRPIRAGTKITLTGTSTEAPDGQIQCEVRVTNEDDELCGIGVATLVS
jgi:3-hydroxybutyryl-CoA dehydratase